MGKIIALSTTVVAFTEADANTRSLTYVKVHNITMPFNYRGSWRIKISLVSDDFGGGSYAKLRKNGVDYSGEFYKEDGSGGTFTTDFPDIGQINAGDTIEVWAHGTTGAGDTGAKAFKIQFTETGSYSEVNAGAFMPFF